MVLVLVWGKEVVELYVELRYLQDTVIYIVTQLETILIDCERTKNLACIPQLVVNSYDNTYRLLLMREGCTASSRHKRIKV